MCAVMDRAMWKRWLKLPTSRRDSEEEEVEEKEGKEEEEEKGRGRGERGCAERRRSNYSLSSDGSVDTRLAINYVNSHTHTNPASIQQPASLTDRQ